MPNTEENRETAGAVTMSLPLLVERLQSLQSAWWILAPSCLTEGGREVVTDARSLQELLSDLSKQPGGPGERELQSAGVELDRLTDSICRLAFEIPIPQLRATLPGSCQSDRGGLLSLLDLLALNAFETTEHLGPKLAAIDYLITLLCTGGDPQARVAAHDPVMLTPGTQAICQSAQEECGARLPDTEAEFFAAASDPDNLRNELQLRTLRARKTELGKSYFVPSMLRAIVTYNVAMLHCAATEAWDAGDWCDDVAADHTESSTSVFESDSLRSLYEAVLRRVAGGPPEASPTGRVAWALDLEYLSPSEKKTLVRGGAPSPKSLHGTIMLIGLLCRSMNVLAIELQDIGITPDALTDSWAKELDGLLKGEVEGLVSGDSYRQACVLSELRNKFLYATMLDVHREKREAVRRPNKVAIASDEDRATRQITKELTSNALAHEGLLPPPKPERSLPWLKLPWLRIILPVGFALVVVVLAGLLALDSGLLNRDLDRFSGSELETVSPYLVRGHRTGRGTGPAFVGRLDEKWSTLAEHERRAAAEHLVEALKEIGITQVMIYDGERRLRIQALGQQIRSL